MDWQNVKAYSAKQRNNYSTLTMNAHNKREQRQTLHPKTLLRCRLTKPSNLERRIQQLNYQVKKVKLMHQLMTQPWYSLPSEMKLAYFHLMKPFPNEILH